MGCREAWLLVALAGCPAPLNYAYQETLPPSAFGPPDVGEPAGREARALLSSARTVAFYPPDYCINVDKDEVARNRTLRANCGVLLSSLERAAEKAGYEVVSWQNLRGTQRPIDYAREAKVDVLFEINEFDFGPVDDAKLQRGIQFTSYPTGGHYTPYTPPGDVANRCAAYAQGRRKPTVVAKVGVIDIKTVSVADGRNRWRYRKSLTRPRAVAYERVAFGSHPKPNVGGMALTIIGAVGLSVGGGLALAQAVSSDDPNTTVDENVDFGSAPLLIIVTSAITLAAGLTMSAVLQKSGGPEEMCGDSTTMTPLITPGNNPPIDEEAENAQIRSEMIGEFVDQIVDVRNSTPPPAAPAPAPAPAPPPAP